MMHKPIRRDSLLERAARAYDFSAGFRAPVKDAGDPVQDDAVPTAMPAPDVEPASVAEEPAWQAAAPIDDPTFLAIPPELRAPVGQELPPAFYETPELSDIAGIDRGMLAEAGMIVPGAPVGPLAEEFRLIKRQLLITRERIAQGHQGDKARTVLVCSARPGDGKTFCAVNLALSMAMERDTEVLLVDADFAKPDVLVRLGLAEQPGLLDALADSRIDVENLVIRTDIGGLSILPAGTKTATDTELLASARTRTVLSRLLDANPRRIVIFDSPPALAASPAAVLAMLVGQVMLVVRADDTPENELREAVQRLDGCDEITLVLNAVSFVPGGRRYGTYYGQEGGK
ncbi:AAA family ATPase [Sphingomonas aquatilis]|uniref:non-specific protein-tyrosine kinase n=1 Tax=Sphingomonas aquatilis TaxID=93063 RepID=A0AAW3TNV7_9SPHN|nr:AAA family ATPase [Sphingomonas aquatilis]MBB3874672.1 exopolysaccharide/PEP-CTERM locus tyrosine autokinase [Sphingomonas aquatilis]MCI4654990.1 AAA family ATPase [Sphingomonas aquatilis]GEM70671.1 chromosome partitioning ATPase [Sphingomonas aquatilis NBRC 16722]